MKPQRWPKPVAFLVFAVALVTGCADMAEEMRVSKYVNGLPLGTPEEEVLKRLGPPSDSGNKFYLGQEKGFEAQYRAAAASTSVRYLFWRVGVADDVVCAVGFDRNRRVSYAGCGGT